MADDENPKGTRSVCVHGVPAVGARADIIRGPRTHEFRHWRITLTIRIPCIVGGLMRDVWPPRQPTSDYNGVAADVRRCCAIGPPR